MTEQVPETIWRKFALLAYAGYAANGRGVIYATPEADKRGAYLYLPIADLAEEPWPSLDAERLAKKYIPARQVVVAVDLGKGLKVAIVENPAPTPLELYEQWRIENGHQKLS